MSTTVAEEVLTPFDRKGSEALEFYVERAEAYFLNLTTDAIFTTIGVYPNSAWLPACKVNGVVRSYIKAHIWYNITNRPGRALYVNGVCVYSGMGVNPPDELLTVIRGTKITTDTKPYQ